MITIKNDTTTSTNMCPNAERFVDDCATVGAPLASEMGRDCNHRNIMQSPVVVQPANECSPSSIMDRFSKFAVAYHIPDLKVFIGNQVVRSDIRVCRLSGKILTLPLNFQMLQGQSLPGFLSVSRLLLTACESSLESLQLVLSFAVVSGILNCLTFRVSQVRFQANINSKLSSRRDMFNFPL